MSNAQLRRTMMKGGMSIEDISTMLIAGGYFRAKIRSLTDFDKVAGGLAWCILNSRHSIDVEFVENAHIRDKIKVAENICGALKTDMQCPHDLEPHQIQGLDYPKIAQVLEWLLKRVAAARVENAHYVAEFTKLDFARRFHTNVASMTNEAHLPLHVADPISAHKKSHRAPKRVMISGQATYASPLEHAATVLLEYGLKYQMKDSILLLQNTVEGDAEMQRDVSKVQDDERKEQAMLEALLAQMNSHRDKARIGAGHLDSIMHKASDNDKIAKLRDGYQARRAALQERLAEEEAARNELERQKQRIDELRAEAENAAAQEAALMEQVEAVQSSADSVREKYKKKIRRLDEQTEGIDDIEKMLRSDQSRSEQFDHLLQLLEDEKEQLRKLDEDREKSKQRVNEAKEEVLELADRMEQLAGEEGKEAFEAELRSLKADLDAVLNELAKRDQEAMGVMRKIDEFPTRAELQQYHVRIGELDEEIAWKFEATRLSYTVYNNRAEVLKCLKNEEDVLQQLSQLVDTCLGGGKNAAKKNAAERQLLLEQSSAIVGQLKASCIKQKERVEEAVAQNTQSRTAYDALLEKQAEYNRLVADTKLRLEENELLQQQLNEAQDATEEAQEDEA
ncbi:Hypothetical protein, putative [Bodo saltans]|uniref:Uncharacterized protein n=1 Tax=Bodo saltans TaxID=75058 RepID=A0A0S4JH67_BODSA|nr:Hypothetical protein, putative [Bodo saltans]|eukprot:CUG89846.1 Hypothetical protein, putative [Bodo saltans]